MNTIVSQAMAAGLPVIATRHSGLPEQVVDGMNGTLVPEGRPDALADAIIEMLSHPERWPEYGRNGRRRAIEKYSRDLLIEEQLKDYATLARPDRRA